jgi:O-antigen/teichoic acid export membrane protein
MSLKSDIPTGGSPIQYAARALRLGKYAFWTAGAAMLPLLMDRLIVHPILSEHLGAGLFGAFLWVLGVVNLVGSVAASGFSTLLMRDFSRQTSESAGRMFRTATTLTIGLSLVIVSVALGFSLVLADETVRSNGWSLYLPLGAFAVLRAISLVLIANLRIKRRFKMIFVLGFAEACVLLLNIVVAPTNSLWLIGCVYVMSVAFTLSLSSSVTAEFRSAKGWLDSSWRRWLLMGWSAAALLNVLHGSQRYLARIVLGAMASVSEVPILYAGTAMASLFLAPVTILSSLVLSLLAGRKDAALSGSMQNAYLVFALGMGVAVATLTWFGGPFLVANRYPDLAPETLKFFHWIAISNGFMTVMILMHPLVVKYGNLNHMVAAAGASFVVQLAVLVVLIPIANAEGAAIGQMVAAAVVAVLWVVMGIRLRSE